ncbi:hypothetical protein FOL47_005578, partial [Perkinsus chesapeaki]
KAAGRGPRRLGASYVTRPHLRCRVHHEAQSVPVDTGCDKTLISEAAAREWGLAVSNTGTSTTLRLMDPEVRMRTCGTCVLQLEYMSGSGWQLASVECLVVTATVMGPLVLGWNFVREHLQGMRWDPFGAIMVGGVTCDMVGAEVRSTYSLVDMPDTRVVEYTSGRVDIISSDFLLTKGPDDQQFTCNW